MFGMLKEFVVLDQQMGGSDDGIERCPKFMAHVAHESGLGGGGLLGFFFSLQRFEFGQFDGRDIEDTDLDKPLFGVFKRDDADKAMKGMVVPADEAGIALPVVRMVPAFLYIGDPGY